MDGVVEMNIYTPLMMLFRPKKLLRKLKSLVMVVQMDYKEQFTSGRLNGLPLFLQRGGTRLFPD